MEMLSTGQEWSAGAARQDHRLSPITEMSGTVSGTGEECHVGRQLHLAKQ